MYRVEIEYNGVRKVIHNYLNSSNRLIEGKISKGINTFSSFVFSYSLDNEVTQYFHPMKTKIYVYFKEKLLFSGFFILQNLGMSESGDYSFEITCADKLSLLQQSAPSFHLFNNVTTNQYLKWYIDEYNAQADVDKKLILKKVDPSENIYNFSDDGKTIWENISNDFIGKKTGEFLVEDNQISVLKEIGKRSDSEISIGTNLLSISREITGNKLITKLYPKGAKLTSESSDVSTARTDIKSVNAGKNYLLASQKLIDEFGIIPGVQTWDDVNDPTILKTKGQAFLDNQDIAPNSFSIKAIDLAVLDYDFEMFEVGNWYFVKQTELGIDEYLRVISITTDIINPEKSTLTFGNKQYSLIEYQRSNQIKYQDANSLLIQKIADAINKQDELKQQMESNKQLSDAETLALQNQIKDLQNQINNISGYLDGKIIDVSEFQSTIDWDKAKADGVVLAIIRVQSGSNHIDLTHKNNIAECQRLGIRYAVYAYASYVSDADAQVEATDFYNRTNTAIGTGTKPVFYMIDVEEQSATNMRSATESWNAEMSALGISQTLQVAYIANHLYDAFNINIDKFTSIVIPSYGANDGTVAGSTQPDHPYDLWQFTSTGKISGITGNVDMNTAPSDRFKNNYLKK